MQAEDNHSSEDTDTGGFVSLSTVANKTCVLFLFVVMASEKNECLAFLSSKLQI